MNQYLLAAFSELYEEDGLLVMAPGIGIKQLFMKFMKAYCIDGGGSSDESARLVFCLHASGQEDILRGALLADGVPYSRLPININNKMNQTTRAAMYSRGGCFFITARIMIVDLLNENLISRNVCGMLVYDADRVGELSMEAFILKLFKEQNPNGFIKAFSEFPDVFGTLQQLERCVKTLQVRRLYLYPRFHGAVVRALSAHQPEVIELSLDLTEPMRKVQEAIMVALDTCLAELKKALPHHDANIFTMKNGLLSGFERSLRSLLDPEFHRLCERTKQLVNQATTIRGLLDFLIRYDAVTFYMHLLSLVPPTAPGVSASRPFWMSTVAGEKIFLYSRERVFTEVPVANISVPGSTSSDGVDESDAALASLTDDNSTCSAQRLGLKNRFRLVLEVPPKWELLKDILSDIRAAYFEMSANEAVSSSLNSPDGGRILIIVKDDYSARQLADYISSLSYNYDKSAYEPSVAGVNGEAYKFQPMMIAKVRLFVTRECDQIRRKLKTLTGGVRSLSIESKMFLCLEEELYKIDNLDTSDIEEHTGIQEYFGSAERNGEPATKRQKKSLGDAVSSVPRYIGMRCVNEDLKSAAVFECPDIGSNSALSTAGGMTKSLLHMMILTHSQVRQRYNCFNDLLPSHVIIMDASLLVIRQLEVYAATTANKIQVFFTMYDKSVEEQRYEASILREKRAFEQLIAHKANMVIPQDAPSNEEGTYSMSQRDRDQMLNPYAMAQIDSRTYTSSTLSGPFPKGVIVDVREFRSALPFTLHNAGLKVIPVTLQVGDYILSPEICVERKGISDLFQSFNSGRLFNQVVLMLKHYKNVCLLVEFSLDKPFSLINAAEITTEIDSKSIISKICLLAMAFPSLKMLWSRSPVSTTAIFKEVKRNFEDVDLAKALAAGTATDAAAGSADDEVGNSGTNSAGLSAEEAIKGAIDMLKKMPGVDDNNVRRLVNAINCVADLADMDEDSLRSLIGPQNAKKLFAFLRSTF